MSFILRYVPAALVTTDVKKRSIISILKIPVSDEIHIEDRNHGQMEQNFEGQSFLVLTNRSRVWPVNHLYHH